MLHECTYCGCREKCGHVSEHPLACCDCYEIFQLGLAFEPWQARGVPERILMKVSRAIEQRPELQETLRRAEAFWAGQRLLETRVDSKENS